MCLLSRDKGLAHETAMEISNTAQTKVASSGAHVTNRPGGCDVLPSIRSIYSLTARSRFNSILITIYFISGSNSFDTAQTMRWGLKEPL